MSKTVKNAVKRKKDQNPRTGIGALFCPEVDSICYKAVIQKTHEGFLLVKHPQGYIMDVNDAFCNMLGYSREELLSMSIKDIEIGFDESLDSIRKRVADTEENGEASFEARHRCKNGRIIDVAISLSHLDENLSFCLHRDITEQKKRRKRELKDCKITSKAQQLIIT